jgi:hypothetical protein
VTKPSPSGGSGVVAAAAKAVAAVAANLSRPSPPAVASDVAAVADAAPAVSRTDAAFKDAFLAEIRKGKPALYNMVVAQAQKIEVAGDRVTFAFSASQRTLETISSRIEPGWSRRPCRRAGRKIAVAAVQQEAAPEPPAGAPAAPPDRKTELRKQAMADAGVQAMLEVFPAEIRDIEEM